MELLRSRDASIYRPKDKARVCTESDRVVNGICYRNRCNGGLYERVLLWRQGLGEGRSDEFLQELGEVGSECGARAPHALFRT